MGGPKGITKVISLTLVAGMMCACIQVRDQTISPARYVSDAPNSGYDIKAHVSLGPGVIGSKLQTNVVSIEGISIPIQMAESGVHPEFDYSGRWRLTPITPFFITGCDFSVRHVAQGRLWGVIPVKDSSTKQIQGDPSRHSLMLYGSDLDHEFIHLSAGTALVETVPITTANGIGLSNSYPTPITVNSITFLCDASDCGSMTDPPITNIIMPSFPVVLNCGHTTFVHFSCTQKAIDHSVGGKVKFGTDRGIVQATFTCFPDQGA